MSHQSYFTIQQEVETELIIQKSRFLVRAKHIPTETAAQEFLTLIQKKHWDATHNCYAYRMNESVQKASDDGEPSGTAGRPILNVLLHNKLLYTMVIITRYFGGIKLGGGGLIRAYSQGASEVIAKAGIVEMVPHQEALLIVDYPYLSKVEHELRQMPLYVESIHYEESIRYVLSVPMELIESLMQHVNTWTHGEGKIHLGKWTNKISHGNKKRFRGGPN